MCPAARSTAALAAATSKFAQDLLVRTPQSGMWAQGTESVSWARLRAEVTRMSDLLAAAGIGSGATVSVRMQPSFTLIWTVLALWNRGAQVALLDPADQHDRLSEPHHIRSSGFGPSLTCFTDECEVVVMRRQQSSTVMNACLVLRAETEVKRYRPMKLSAELARLARRTGAPIRGERTLLLGPLTRYPWWVLGVLQPLYTGATLVLPHRTGQSTSEPVDVVIGPATTLPASLDLQYTRIITGGGLTTHDVDSAA